MERVEAELDVLTPRDVKTGNVFIAFLIFELVKQLDTDVVDLRLPTQIKKSTTSLSGWEPFHRPGSAQS